MSRVLRGIISVILSSALLFGCDEQSVRELPIEESKKEIHMTETKSDEERTREYISDNKEEYEKRGIDLEILLAEDIVLKYGEIGKYGKEEVYDGVKYINYYLPVGEYKVTNLSNKLSVVFVESNEMYKNGDGYWDNDIIKRIEFTKQNDSQNISIDEKMHITLSINSEVKFSRTDWIIN
jgi:hypothetical protein